jgi:hypothetical protein
VQEIGNDLEVVANYYGVERLEEMCKRLKFGYVVVRESSFAQDFGVLMEEPMRYSDVAFLVEGVPIKAHKVFLAASSEYFKGMFTSGLKEAQQDEIDLPHVREPIFRYPHNTPHTHRTRTRTHTRHTRHAHTAH